jgi:hypothetical protein
LANFVVAVHPLEYGPAAMIAGLATFAASSSAINWDVGGEFQFQFERARGRRSVLLLAARTQDADQPLGQHRLQRRRHEIRFHPHIDQACQGTRRIVGMQRGENEVTRKGGLHGNLRCLLVADFADENHIRVVTQNRAQPAREG